MTDSGWSDDSGSGTLTNFADGTSASENHPSFAAADVYSYVSTVNDSDDASAPTYSTSSSLNSAYSDTYSSSENASAWVRSTPSGAVSGLSTFTVSETEVSSSRNRNSGDVSQQQGDTYTSSATWSNTDDLNVNYSNSGGQAIGNGASIAWDSYHLSLSDHATYTLSRTDSDTYLEAEPVVGSDGQMTATFVTAGTSTSWNGSDTRDNLIQVHDSTDTPLSSSDSGTGVEDFTTSQGYNYGSGSSSVVTVSHTDDSGSITDDGAGDEIVTYSDDSDVTTTTTYSDGTSSVTSSSQHSGSTSTGASTLTDAFYDMFILPPVFGGGSPFFADVWLLGGAGDIVAPGTSLPTSGSTTGGMMLGGSPGVIVGPSFSSFGAGQLVPGHSNGGAGPTLGAGTPGLVALVAGGAEAGTSDGFTPLTMGTSAADDSGGSSDDLATAIGDAPIWGYLNQGVGIADEALDPIDKYLRGETHAGNGEGVGSFVDGAMQGRNSGDTIPNSHEEFRGHHT